MEITIIAVLNITLLIMIIVRIILQIVGNKPAEIEEDIGKSMTIGDREIQEDTIGVMKTSQGTLLVLADGMGKNYGGRVAGRIAVDIFEDIFTDYNAFENPQYYFKKAFNASNREILKTFDDERGSACVAAAIITKGILYYATVGNIKIAIYRDEDLIPVTEGHTVDVLAQRKYYQGKINKQETLSLLQEHRLYNYVGQDGFKDIEIFDQPITLKKNDIVVLMSDGVYECTSWREIEEVLQENRISQEMAYKIIEKINQSKKENKDNASIILKKVIT